MPGGVDWQFNRVCFTLGASCSPEAVASARSSMLARPYMDRLSVFIRLICPSVCPLLLPGN